MRTIKIYDRVFSHNPYSVKNTESDYFKWDVNPDPATIEDCETVFFTELSMDKAIELKDREIERIGWIIESPAIIGGHQLAFIDNLDIFSMVFTFRKDLLDHPSKKFKFLPCWGSWIHYNQRRLYTKSKNLSIIASAKNWTDGHLLRQSVIDKFGNTMDVFGTGRPVEISNKLKGLQKYRYSIVIENTKQDYYFSEKLLDCFATGTVPIYWGCPSVSKYFNEDGIIQFDTIEQLEGILKMIGKKDYDFRIPAIRTNLIEMNRFKCPEDFLINYDL